jgi:hypothetical protein
MEYFQDSIKRKNYSSISTILKIIWWLYSLIMLYALVSEIMISIHTYNNTIVLLPVTDYFPIEDWGNWFKWMIFLFIIFLPGLIFSIFYFNNWKSLIVLIFFILYMIIMFLMLIICFELGIAPHFFSFLYAIYFFWV